MLLAAGGAALLHLLMLGSLPLILTPDSGEYIRTALDLGKEGARWAMPNRTPGYPVLLYATFALFGDGAGGILVVQNLLAVGTCALLAWGASRLAGPAIGLAVGLLYALEPWSLALANYALTETATVFAVVLAATLVLVAAPSHAGCGDRDRARDRRRVADAPGGPDAWSRSSAWRGSRAARSRLRRRLVLAAVLAATFGAAVTPWLAYNASRGVRGFASGSGWVLWYGVTIFGFLDRDYPIDPATKAIVDRNLAPASATGRSRAPSRRAVPSSRRSKAIASARGRAPASRRVPAATSRACRTHCAGS